MSGTPEQSPASGLYECEKCGENLPFSIEVEISLAQLRHRTDCIANGFHECPKCGGNLLTSSKDQLPDAFRQHRVDCEFHFRKVILTALWQNAKKEIKVLEALGGANHEERRASLEEDRDRFKKTLDNPKILRAEIENVFNREDAAEADRQFEKVNGHPRGVRRPIHIEWRDGSRLFRTDTPKELADEGWHWIEDNKWRKAGYLPEEEPGWRDQNGEVIPSGSPVWIECPSTADGKGPNPYDYFTMYYRREEDKIRRKKTPEWVRVFERVNRKRNRAR